MKEFYGNIHYYYCRFGVGRFMMISLDSMIESRLTASNKRGGLGEKDYRIAQYFESKGQ